LPAAGQFVGQKAWINDSPVVIKEWDGANWDDITPTFGGGSDRYDPWRLPSVGVDANASDEFIGGIDTGLYTFGNQGTATAVASLDNLELVCQASVNIDRKIIWYPAPNGNFVFATVASGSDQNNAVPFNGVYGLAMLFAGDPTTPTHIEMGIIDRLAATTSVAMYNATSYTAAYLNAIGATALNDQWGFGGPWVYMRWFYDDNSNNLSFDVSQNGFAWWRLGTRAGIATDPTYVGIFCDQNTANQTFSTRFGFVRTLTDGSQTTAPYPIGE
jgi:hypothetical protein